jgi:TonB family protein
MLFPVGFYDTEGRHINGIIGRDVLADSLVFGFDRNQGIAMLSTIKAFAPPPDAVAIKYQAVSSTTASGTARAGTSVLAPFAPGDAGTRQPAGTSMTPRDSPQGRSIVDTPPVDRRLASAQIGTAKLSMHLDLGATVSQLSEASWAKAGLVPTKIDLRLIDEAAAVRHVTSAGVAAEVEIGTARTQQVTFVPYIERRFGTLTVDGALGLDFFRPYTVFVNWDSKVYYLKPRGDAAAAMTARLGRWGAALPSCAHPGCVTVAVADGALSVTRDSEAAGRGLEVMLSVGAQGGASPPPLIVELPAETGKVTSQLPVDYAHAALVLTDVSPFPRTCVGSVGCVVPLLAPGASPPSAEPAAPTAPANPPPPAAPAEAPAVAPKTVALDKLHRLSGSPTIPPSDDVKKAAAASPLSAAILKVCIGADGRVESMKLVKSSGVPAYDQQLQSTIQSTWAFEPVVTDGKPASVCATATFVGH